MAQFGFEYWRRGEPPAGEANTSSYEFQWFRCGEASVTLALGNVPQTITLSGIASVESLGPVGVSAADTLSLASIAGAESFGSAVLSTGDSQQNVAAITSLESFGAPSVSTGDSNQPISAITSAESFGATALTFGDSQQAVAGIGSSESFGANALSAGDSSQALSGIGSGETLSAPVLSAGDSAISFAGIGTAEVFAAVAIGSSTSLSATGIVSAETFGSTVLSGNANLALPGIAGAETFGTPFISNGTGHAYWRIHVTHGGGGAISISEFKLYDSLGTQIATTGGTASASSTVGGFVAANAFDGNNATFWASASSGVTSETLQYQFPSPEDARSFSLRNRQDSNPEQVPYDFTLDYSDDGSTWFTLYSYFGVNWGGTAGTLGLTQTFNAANAAPSPLGIAYRLLITATGGFVGSTSIAEWVLYDPSGNPVATSAFAAPSSSVVTTEDSPGYSAFDGNVNTYWASQGTPSIGSPEWLAHQLASALNIGSFSIRARNDADYNQSPGSFSLQSSHDMSTWTTITSYTAAAWTSASQVQRFGLPAETNQPCFFVVT